ncbi:3-oxoacyl-[acyl-carrier protein] reductase [Duganella sp. 1224]|uniref:SDR family oxidoreductase n=1 Tax=Duganella sp. 1224 TaxID=2587052 RepID=UPI0015CA44DC|nr:SDR family oxidoreductase [Duganella sp. 1224]NYE59424.1 3-oxoacyl-[acyl-carrier protein] reductase [Duganella sp. 1224]
MQTSAHKVAIVTGASRGIGQTIARRLASDGYAVVVNYAGNAEAAAAVVAAIQADGGAAVAVKADVSQPDAVRGLFASARQAFGRVDVVVANGGIMKNALIGDMPLADFDQIVNVNLRGAFLLMAEASRHLGRGGRFIALSTSVIAKNVPSYGAYIASKAGVEGLVKVFANELRGRNITVNAVAPGPVATELFFEGKSDEQVAHIIMQSPLERIGQPKDIADAVSFLASEQGGWINGQVIRSNGGFA